VRYNLRPSVVQHSRGALATRRSEDGMNKCEEAAETAASIYTIAPCNMIHTLDRDPSTMIVAYQVNGSSEE
jgi:hypothetical protein